MLTNPKTDNKIKYSDFNSIVKELAYDMDDQEARLLLTRFLKHNIGFTFQLISGMQLLPVQEIILRGLILKDNSLLVAGRGVGKSFLISVFCTLFPIFNPNSKLCLISVNFRGARRLFDASEKMVRGKNADLLAACFPNPPKRSNDCLSWKLPNQSEIFALPLSNGEGLRGTRASVVLVDEGLLISREIQQSIIRPFLTARQNYSEELQMREIENALIARGEIKEEDRMSFPSNKYLIFSSASYQFEYLYEIFQEYISNITNPIIEIGEDKIVKKKPSYFVMRLSYEALPKESFIDLGAIEAARDSGGENSEYFKREYRSLFSAGNDGYFNVKQLHKCTIPDGQEPCVQLKGDSESKYILAIDPSYSKARNSDYFAMGVYLLIPEKREMVLVHTYGRAGADLRDHYIYLTYILTNFNIVYTIIDGSGSEFVESYNESTIAKERSIKLGFFKDVNFEKDDYLNQVQQAKVQYNQTTRNFVYPQYFTSDSIRRMNEYLQAQIDAGKIWFASRICNNEDNFKREQDKPLGFDIKSKENDGKMTSFEMCEEQDIWVTETKNQLALIEVKSTINGILQYNLPHTVRNDESPNRARRDHYTCCLLAAYGAKQFFDIMFTAKKQSVSTFTPFFC